MVLFSDELNDKTVRKFIDECNERLTNEEDILDIYFTTNGGFTTGIMPIVRFLIKNQMFINFFIDFECSSAGIILLSELNKNKVPVYMTPTFSHGIHHKVTIQNDNDLILDSVNDYGKETDKIINKHLTKEQIKQYEKGRNVVLVRKDILRLFPNIKEVDYNGDTRKP